MRCPVSSADRGCHPHSTEWANGFSGCCWEALASCAPSLIALHPQACLSCPPPPHREGEGRENPLCTEELLKPHATRRNNHRLSEFTPGVSFVDNHWRTWVTAGNFGTGTWLSRKMTTCTAVTLNIGHVHRTRGRKGNCAKALQCADIKGRQWWTDRIFLQFDRRRMLRYQWDAPQQTDELELAKILGRAC